MNVEQLRKQAKDLVKAARAGDPDALARLGDLPVQLASAQLVLAREHGYSELARTRPRRGRAAVPHRHRVLRGARRGDRDRERRLDRRGATRSRPAPRLLQLGRAPAARRQRSRAGRTRRRRSSSPTGRSRKRRPSSDSSRAARPAPGARRAARHERQRPVRNGERARGGPAAPRPRRRRRTAATTTAGRSSTRRRTGTTPSSPGYCSRRVHAPTCPPAGTAARRSSLRSSGVTARSSTLLGLEPRNLRVAAGLGRVDLIDELAGTPAAGAHRGFYRPHGGFPAWEPSDDPQEILDEALVWAAKADRVEAIDRLVELGARIEADPYRGHAARLGGDQRARRRRPAPRRARRRPQRARHLRRAEPRPGRSAAPPRRPGGSGGRRSTSCSSSAPIRRSATRSTTATRPAGRRTAAGPISRSGCD